MQTYLPFTSFVKVASTLDTETLERQRENAETLLYFILCKSEELTLDKKRKKEFAKINENPVFHYWWNNGAPYALALCKYLDACNFELFNRKQGLGKFDWMKKIIVSSKSGKFHPGNPPMPKRITTGYRIILMCRNEKFYKDKFYATFRKQQKTISELNTSKERFKFAKFLGLVVPE